MYIIIEIQTNEESCSVLHEVQQERNQAESVYHDKLHYAAVSNVRIHSVTMLNDAGERLKGEVYYH